MDKREDLLQHFEFKKKVRGIKVSTDDFEVRMHLRQLKHPMCFFGEDEADRRERLRQIIAKSDGLIPLKRKKQSDIEKEQQSSAEDTDKVWYHRGTEELREARNWMLKYSMLSGFQRRNRLKEARASMNETQRKALAQEYHKRVREIECISTTNCAVRPLSSCQFSPNSHYLATGSWDGKLRVFSVPNMDDYWTFSAAHSGRMSSVIWNPKFGKEDSCIDLASSDHDGVVKFWSLAEDSRAEPVGVLEGLEGKRVGKLGFHPSGRLLATPSYDMSWRLWDLTTGTELQMQEGHTGAVTDCKFHPDGSLVISCDMAGYARIWDIRTGRCVFFMEGHAGPVLCADWSAGNDGCGGSGTVTSMVATGSEDGSAKIWELRSRICAYTIASHASSVTAVRFQQCQLSATNTAVPGAPHFLVTASLDRTCRLWAHPVWTPLKELNDHVEKIMAMDVASCGKYLATAAYDRNVKLWEIPSTST